MSAYPPGKCGDASEGRGETPLGTTDTFGARDLRPDSNVNVYFDGTHTLLASGQADNSGNFVATVRFPSHATAGQHEVILIGQNPNGSPSAFSAPVTLDAAVGPGTVAAASSGQPLTDLSLAGFAAAAIGVLAGGGIVVTGRRRRSVGGHARGR